MPEFPTRIEMSLIDSKWNHTCILTEDLHHFHIHTHTRFHICAFESGQRKQRGSDNRLNMDHTCVPGYSEPRTFRSHTGRLRQDLLIRHSVMEQVRAGSH